MGGRDRRELESRLCVVLVHLLKWQGQPGKRGASWRKTLRTQRREIRELLQAEPEPAAAGAGTGARSLSGRRQGCGRRDRPAGRPVPAQCPYASDDVLSEDYLPDETF